MKVYFNSFKKYAYNKEEKLIYKVVRLDTFDDADYAHVFMELVAFWDYKNPDENDIQGWCPADRAIEEVQDETVQCCIFKESIETALEENDYTVLDELPSSIDWLK